MISIAIGPYGWLSYSTETASIHQFWRGELDFHRDRCTTPSTVRSRRAGALPSCVHHRTQLGSSARGQKRIGRPAKVRWRGHGFDPKSDALWLRYELTNSVGAAVIVTEWPEQIFAGERTGLERRFVTTQAQPPTEASRAPGAGTFDPALQVALRVDPDAPDLEVVGGDRIEDSLIVLTSGETSVTHWFDAPKIEIPASLDRNRGNESLYGSRLSDLSRRARTDRRASLERNRSPVSRDERFHR